MAPDLFIRSLQSRGVRLFTGVPDSLLSGLCAYLDSSIPPSQHIIAANEGNAVAIAIGHHLATGHFAMVYMQNSGLGNAINPLTSLAAKEVYAIPMLLVVGWRGMPGVVDEPQHLKQGAITEEQLSLLGIQTWVVDSSEDAPALVSRVCDEIEATGSPCAILVKAGAFDAIESQKSPVGQRAMLREEALRIIYSHSNSDDLFVSTTGKTSRELDEILNGSESPRRAFLTVGGMGHTSSIALGLSIGLPHRRIICIDGDGSLLMHMGALPIVADLAPKNLVHIVINNGSHESVGGQPTVASRISLAKLARASGYPICKVASTGVQLRGAVGSLLAHSGPSFVEVLVSNGSRRDLGRPQMSPKSNKRNFMAGFDGKL